MHAPSPSPSIHQLKESMFLRLGIEMHLRTVELPQLRSLTVQVRTASR